MPRQKHIDGMTFQVLLDEATLQARVQELGREIAEAYQGRDLAIVAVLKGSFVFMADLVRAIDAELTVDFLGVSSYGDSEKSSGVVKITKDLTTPITDRDVLLVEDIVDTGLTMQYLLSNLETRGPSSIQVATLLHKPARTEVEVPIHFKGFTIEDKFVIGYGLDYKQRYRNLPFIGYKID